MATGGTARMSDGNCKETFNGYCQDSQWVMIHLMNICGCLMATVNIHIYTGRVIEGLLLKKCE